MSKKQMFFHTLFPRCFILDVDGVITDPTNNNTAPEEIIKLLVTILTNGEYIIFSTGRTLPFVREHVLKELTPFISPKLLGKIIVMGEKGGIHLTFSKQGDEQIFTNTHVATTAFSLLQQQVAFLAKQFFQLSSTQDEEEIKTFPQGFSSILKQIQNLARLYPEVIFFDKEKETMITLEMSFLSGKDISYFTSFRNILKEKKLFEQLLVINKLDKDFHCLYTSLGIDIESTHLGKAYATDCGITYLNKKGIVPKAYIAIGDSPPDYSMVAGLEKRGLKTVFAYVGDIAAMDKEKKENTIYYDKLFTKGTIHILSECISQRDQYK